MNLQKKNYVIFIIKYQNNFNGELNMKNLIIIMGTIVLGVFIFNMMVGDGENSLKNISRDVMMKTVENYRWEM